MFDERCCWCHKHVPVNEIDLCVSCAEELRVQLKIQDMYDSGILKCVRYEIDSIVDLTHDDVPRMLLLCWLTELGRDPVDGYPEAVIDQFSPRTLELNMN